MQVTHNDNGTVTVRILKSDEVYDPATSTLGYVETMTEAEFTAALHPPKAPAPKPDPVQSEKDRLAAEKAEAERVEGIRQAEAQELEATRERLRVAAEREQADAAEKARLSEQVHVDEAKVQADALAAAVPAPPKPVPPVPVPPKPVPPKVAPKAKPVKK